MSDFLQEGRKIRHDPLKDIVTTTADRSRWSPKYGFVFDRCEVNVTYLDYVSLQDVPNFIHRLLDQLISKQTDRTEPHHKIRICIDSTGLECPIWTSPIDKK